jgi:hypothetical protein
MSVLRKNQSLRQSNVPRLVPEKVCRSQLGPAIR